MMNDPMAGMGQDPSAATTPDNVDSKEVFDPMILQFNLQRIERVRSVMGITSGCIAGIAGLTGWEGIGMNIGVWCNLSTACSVWLDPTLFLNPFLHDVRCFFFSSLLSDPSRVCESNDLGLEDEFQSESIHTTILVQIHDRTLATNRSFLYALLDTLLWSSVSLLS